MFLIAFRNILVMIIDHRCLVIKFYLYVPLSFFSLVVIVLLIVSSRFVEDMTNILIYMAMAQKDWEVLIGLAKIDIDRGLYFPVSRPVQLLKKNVSLLSVKKKNNTK